MAIRNIVKDGDSILHKECRNVDKFNERLWQLLDDMAETMYEANGVGLAAPQVGIKRRAVVIDVDEELIELINPEIIFKSEENEEDMEGCLSFPGQWGMVERPVRVRVRAQDRNGKFFEAEGEGLLARCMCHEIDHLNGTVFTDIVTRMLTEEEVVELSNKRENQDKTSEVSGEEK